jgi:molecular chaperone DnaK (HSP70)
MTGPLSEPVLAIDFGTSFSSAYLIIPSPRGAPEWIKILDPRTRNDRWPSAVLATGDDLVVGGAAEEDKLDFGPGTYRTEFKLFLGSTAPFWLGGRRYLPEELAQKMIQAMADLAVGWVRSRTGRANPELRAVLTVPASYAREEYRALRHKMIQLGEGAGLFPVELLYEPVAAAWSVRKQLESQRGRLVLVYDYGGGTFDTALVNLQSGETWPRQILGVRSVHEGGKDIDAALARLLREKSGDWRGWRTATKAAGGDRVNERERRVEIGARATAELMKRQLSTRNSISGQILGSEAPTVSLSVAELEEIARPHIARTIDCCRQLLTDSGKTAADLDAILVAGGTSKMRLVARMLQEELRNDMTDGLPLPLLHREEGDLAVAEGAATWAIDHEIPDLKPEPGSSHGSALRWNLDRPAGEGFTGPTLMRWLVNVGQERHEEYRAGQPLARIRYKNGTLWDLAAAEPGTFGQVLADPPESRQGMETGIEISSRQWLASTERRPSA